MSNGEIVGGRWEVVVCCSAICKRGSVVVNPVGLRERFMVLGRRFVCVPSVYYLFWVIYYINLLCLSLYVYLVVRFLNYKVRRFMFLFIVV